MSLVNVSEIARQRITALSAGSIARAQIDVTAEELESAANAVNAMDSSAFPRLRMSETAAKALADTVLQKLAIDEDD